MSYLRLLAESYVELASGAFKMLSLPHSNAEGERVFSTMNVVNSKLRNRMQLGMISVILTIRYALKRKQKCCESYFLPQKMVGNIWKMVAYYGDQGVDQGTD